MKKLLSVVLCLSLLLSLFSCGQSEQDKKFDELTSKTSAVSSEASLPEPEESSAVSQEETSSTAEENTNLPENWENYIQELEWGEMFDIEPNTELSGELTIGVDSSETLEPWIEAFKAVYPNVEIKTKLYPIVSNDSTQALIVDLNSGEAGDILYINYISWFKYAESGLLLDLYPFMDADPDIQREDYYPNILKALETRDGKLCSICPSINMGNVFFNTQVTDQLGINFREDYPDGMDYKDIAELYQRCLNEGVLDAGSPLSPFGSKLYLNNDVIMDYLDEVTHECDFENPAFIEYLETMNSIPAGVPAYSDVYPTDFAFSDTSQFMIRGGDAFNMFMRYLRRDENLHASVWVPLKTESGKKPFEVVKPVGITSACQNPELAWEFIKFMISEKPFPTNQDHASDMSYMALYSYGVPIHRENFKGLYHAYFTNEELFQYVEEMYAQRNVLRFKDPGLNLAWMEIYANFFEHDLISAEDCAKQLQERTWIYMNE